jgi:hypothetical protein
MTAVRAFAGMNPLTPLRMNFVGGGGGAARKPSPSGPSSRDTNERPGAVDTTKWLKLRLKPGERGGGADAAT